MIRLKVLAVERKEQKDDKMNLAFVFLLCVQTLPFLRGEKVNITLCTMMVEEGKMPFKHLKSGAAIDIALEKIPSILGADVNVNFVYKTYGDDCVANHIGALAAELYYTHNVTAFIGTGCSIAVDVLGRMASSWNLPLLSPVATAKNLGNKKDFRTLTRLSYDMTKFSNFYVRIFDHYEWSDIAIIYETGYVFFTIVGEALTEVLQKVGRTVFTQWYDDFEPGIHERLLQRAAQRSRVIIIALFGDSLRHLMLTAQKLDMTNGEFVFIYVRLFKGDNVGDTTWRRNDNLDELAMKAYESVLILQLRIPENKEFLEFEKDVKTRALRDYNYTYNDEDVNLFITASHDAFLIYATVLRQMLDSGEDFMDGKLVSDKIWNNTFQGIGGTIVIDENGDRDTDFSMLDMDPVTGDYRVVANYLGIVKDMVFSKDYQIHWPNDKGPPANRPRCGFTGDDPICQIKEDRSQLIMLVAIFTGSLIILVGIFILAYRKYKLESDLKDQWWRVKWSDIKQGTAVGSITGSQRISIETSSMRTTTGVNKDVAMFKGISVVLKRLNIKAVKTDRKALFELKQMRELTCPNLTQFFGLCVECPNICILTEHCSRGSLRDMLHNESIKLDRDFRLSLTNDIIEGTIYLHNSPLIVHGRLNSDNCRIDGRFVLKLTDFGIPFLYRQIDKADFNQHDLLWIAPEHLRMNPFIDVSQAGDVYSFAMVLYEMFTRNEPFEDDLEVSSVNEVLEHIKSSIPHRQDLGLVEEEEVRSIISDCWVEDPSLRPPLSLIKKRHRALSGNNRRHILDALLQRMEQYANNLEGLVEERTLAFLEEKKRSEELLYQVLPKSVADKLKNGFSVDAEAYESVTIYFSDIVGFTSISADSTAMQVVDLLNDIYTCFDSVLENFDVYKVETIGDAYMVVSGLPIRNGNEHVRQIARMSLSLLLHIHEIKIRHLPERPLLARIGLHTGPVCAGVVGRKMPRYCLFGDTVNTASRMESNGEAMKIHISESSMLALQQYNSFQLEPRGEIQIKGKGLMQTYWLLSENKPK